jgi:hypothetical protein
VRRRFLLLLLAAAAAFPGAAAASWALSASGPGAAKAKTLGAGNTPSVSASGHKVTVTWTATSYIGGGGTAAGYRVRRYNAVTGVGQDAANGCSGAIAGLTCTEASVPAGSWRYTVTPATANWRGPESGMSAVVVVP